VKFKVGDLIQDRYHDRYDVIIKVWGTKETCVFLKLANGDKIAAAYARLVNESR